MMFVREKLFNRLETPVFLEMAKARKKHFIDRFNWDIPTYTGGEHEIDQFDTSSALYVWFERRGVIFGSFRVLHHSTSMTKEIWPQFMPHIPEDSFEISRLCLHVDRINPYDRAELSDTMRRWFNNFSESHQASAIYGCADRRTLALWRSFYGTKAKKIILDPDSDPDLNIAIWK